MQIEYIREFITLGQSRSYTDAAKKLYLNQVTLSRHLEMLEKDVGVKLVDRTPSGIRLNRVGRVFLDKMIDVMRVYDASIESMKDYAGRQVSDVVVGGELIEPGIFQLLTWATSLLDQEDQPVRVQISDHFSSLSLTDALFDPLESLRSGGIDVAIDVGYEGDDWDGIAYEVVKREPFSFYVSERHPLCGEPSVSLREICEYPIVVGDPTTALNKHLAQVFRENGINPKLETRVSESFGQFVSHVDDSQVHLLLDSFASFLLPPSSVSTLRRLEPEGPGLYADVRAAWLEGSNNPGIPLFAEALKRVSGEGRG